MQKTILQSHQFILFRRPNHESIRQICNEMGYYHQSQNDFLDVFNIGGALNKTSNDIENGSRSWLATNCYYRANPEQKKILVDNYGKRGKTNQSYHLFT